MLSLLSKALASSPLTRCLTNPDLAHCTEAELQKIQASVARDFHALPSLFSHNHPMENLHFSEKLQAFKPVMGKSETVIEESIGWVRDHSHAIDLDFTDLQSALRKIIHPEIEPATAAATQSPAASTAGKIDEAHPDELPQPTEEELLAHIRSVPIPEGWKLTTHEVILPLSVTQMWDIVWSNEGIYDMDKALSHFGDIYGARTMWEPASEGETFRKTPLIAKKTVHSKNALPPNPLQSHVDGLSKNYLLQQDELGMIVEQENTGKGFMYADALVIRLRWEVH